MKLFNFLYSILILLVIASLKIIGIINALSLAIFLHALKPFIINIIYNFWTLKHQFKTIQIHSPKYKIILPFILIAALGVYRLFFSFEEIAENLSVSEIVYLSLSILFYFISHLLFSDKDTLHFNNDELVFKTSYETKYLWKDIESWKITSKYLTIYLKTAFDEVIMIQLINAPNEKDIIKNLNIIKPPINDLK
jgi:hypothetical protein